MILYILPIIYLLITILMLHVSFGIGLLMLAGAVLTGGAWAAAIAS
jgi:hypothetical protein